MFESQMLKPLFDAHLYKINPHYFVVVYTLHIVLGFIKTISYIYIIYKIVRSTNERKYVLFLPHKIQ